MIWLHPRNCSKCVARELERIYFASSFRLIWWNWLFEVRRKLERRKVFDFEAQWGFWSLRRLERIQELIKVELFQHCRRMVFWIRLKILEVEREFPCLNIEWYSENHKINRLATITESFIDAVIKDGPRSNHVLKKPTLRVVLIKLKFFIVCENSKNFINEKIQWKPVFFEILASRNKLRRFS